MVGLIFPPCFLLAGFFSFVAVLTFAVYLFSLLEAIARNTRDSSEYLLEASRSLYRLEKATEDKDTVGPGKRA